MRKNLSFTPSTRCCPWWLPWLISIAIHAAVALAFSYVSAPRTDRVTAFDTRLPTPDDREIQLSLVEEPGPPARILQLHQPPSSVPVVPTVEAPPTARAPEIQPVAAAAPIRAPEGARSGGAARSANGTATTEFFRTPTEAHSIVYVVDRSISMGLNGALAIVKQELTASIAQLPSGAQFQVIVFNRSPKFLEPGGMLSASPAHKAKAIELLAELRAEGGTDHLPALQLALSLEPEAMFFLTDASDLSANVARTITRNNHGRTVIHTIDFSAGSASMEMLAATNRGMYRTVGR